MNVLGTMEKFCFYYSANLSELIKLYYWNHQKTIGSSIEVN